jgi:aldose 1-epimerase
MSLPATASAAEAVRSSFGALEDGTAVEAVTLTNEEGMSARIITLGATLQALEVPDRDGGTVDIVLGYDTAAEYLANPQYFGATVGRYANRIAGARFTLDGQAYTLAANDGLNALHGGPQGFDKRVWSIQSVEDREYARVVLAYTSPAGEEGYPGNLQVTATYTLTEDNQLMIEYGARTDAPTIVNITNHSFFNLAGAHSERSATGHVLTLDAARFTPVDETLIPTGELRPVGGTPFDFTKPTFIKARIRDGEDVQLRIGRGYDHNYVIDGEAGQMRPAVRLEDPESGRVMELLSDAPGVQFYSGNFLDGTAVGKGQRIYRQGDGLCFEPQVFPDSPNQAGFPDATLEPGETYRNAMVLRFSTTPR